ncbi:MAG: hypothetical protein MK200_08470, partial [Nitrosopumilus sp.]|nr:hypothetical protein [Nitrosopumilus sp.]
AVFTEIEKSINKNSVCQISYLSKQYQLYRMGYQINPDNHLLSIKSHHKEFDIMYKTNDEENTTDAAENPICQMKSFGFIAKKKYFEEAENAGSEILYRCVDCRKCTKCRNGEKIELISIREEVEQDIINKSISVDVHAGITTARLPLLDNPVLKLAPNKDKALAIYRNQVRRLNRNETDKRDVITSEGKLQYLGHVDYVRNLPPDQQKMLNDSPIQHFIPWRSVWNRNSLTTPCRIVYDASHPTSSSYSLNDILPKGRNNMNKLLEIVIRWMAHKHAFHTDVQKMYNTVKLIEEHWCLQRYLWQEELKPDVIPEEKIIKTLIYGVKSSGNQAERGLRNTAEMFKEQYPEVNQIVQKDICR